MSQRAVVLHDKMTLRNLVVRPLKPLKEAGSLKVHLNGHDTGFKCDLPAGKIDPVACVGEMDIKRGDVISLAWLPRTPHEPMDIGFESRREGAGLEWFSLNDDGALGDPRGRARLRRKLVRDKIPILIAKKGDRVPYNAPASGARLQGYVAAKLAEEGTEFAEAPSLDELADVQEVVDTALRTFGWTRTQLGEAMRKKREERGGFSKGIIMYFNPDDEVPPP